MLSSQNSQLAIGGPDRLGFAAGFFFLLTLTFAPFAAGRLHFRFDVPTPLRDTALVAFVFSGLLQTGAMLVHQFFSPVVQLQTERGHHVIAEGLSQFRRYPGYLAMLAAVPASATALRSWIALIPAARFQGRQRCLSTNSGVRSGPMAALITARNEMVAKNYRTARPAGIKLANSDCATIRAKCSNDL